MEKLKFHNGYLLDDMVTDAIKELGEDFMVVVKKSTGQRDMVALKNLKKYGRYTSKQRDPIKNVFVSVDKFDRLFPEK
jgi:hypothetical protein